MGCWHGETVILIITLTHMTLLAISQRFIAVVVIMIKPLCVYCVQRDSMLFKYSRTDSLVAHTATTMVKRGQQCSTHDRTHTHTHIRRRITCVCLISMRAHMWVVLYYVLYMVHTLCTFDVRWRGRSPMCADLKGKQADNLPTSRPPPDTCNTVLCFLHSLSNGAVTVNGKK